MRARNDASATAPLASVRIKAQRRVRFVWQLKKWTLTFACSMRVVHYSMVKCIFF